MSLRTIPVREKNIDMINRELAKAVKIFGTKYKISKTLGLNCSSVYHWFKSGYVSPQYAYELERMTKNNEPSKQLKKHKLCPEVYPPKDYK